MIEILELPASNTPRLNYSVILDETEFDFKFAWNTRQESWYLTITDREGIILLSNIRLVPNVDLLLPYVNDFLPQGSLYLTTNDDTFPQSPPITLENLSTEFFLAYVTE